MQEVLRWDQAFFDHNPKGDLVGRLMLVSASRPPAAGPSAGLHAAGDNTASWASAAPPSSICLPARPLAHPQDVATLQTTLADLIGQRGLRSLMEVAGPMLIIAAKHPLMAVITCAVTPALSRALRNVVVRSTELSYERQQVAAAALEFASDRLSHVQTVQVGQAPGWVHCIRL